MTYGGTKFQESSFPGPFSPNPGVSSIYVYSNEINDWVKIYIPDALDLEADINETFRSNDSASGTGKAVRRYRIYYTDNLHVGTAIEPLN